MAQSLFISEPRTVRSEEPCARRVLVVDDDAGFRYLCARLLEDARNEYEVLEADSVAEAREQLTQGGWDCVLADFHLSDGNATDLLEAAHEDLPVIVMTSGGSEDVVTEVLRAGAADYIRKPSINPQSLARMLDNAIDKAQLRRSVHERNAKLQAANDRLQAQAEEIARFYHCVSHEIKTPLTSIRVYLSLLGDGYLGELSPEQSQAVTDATLSCDELTQQFNDLLECTRLETGKLRIRPEASRVDQIVRRAVSSIRPALEAKEQRLAVEIDQDLPSIVADQGRFVQVLGNLLGNAVKFTPEEGRIRVSARLCPDRVRHLEFEVADTGIGIAPEHRQKIFRRLYQVRAESDEASSKGLGLGLTICREIVELHGGTLSVDSTVGQGSTFTIRVPLDGAPERSEEKQA